MPRSITPASSQTFSVPDTGQGRESTSLGASPSIVIFIPYFGSWPEWIDLFFETARRNATIDFLVVTDCDAKEFAAPNIRIRQTSFTDYVEQARSRLGVPFDPPNGYKICDLRPMFGALHEDEFSGYDFYGWCDTDLLLGDIRSFYTDEILTRYDVLSTHADRISGHFALFRNTRRNRTMYRRIYQWQRSLLEPEFIGLDEPGITKAYLWTSFDKANVKFGWHLDNVVTRLCARWKRRQLYLVEQYTTPFLPKPWLDDSLNSAQPDEWFYRDGHITNSRDDREFMYLHLMNFKSSRWRHDGTRAPWEDVTRVCHATPSDMETGIIIDKSGISPATVR
jgi:hypothetical protein